MVTGKALDGSVGLRTRRAFGVLNMLLMYQRFAFYVPVQSWSKSVGNTAESVEMSRFNNALRQIVQNPQNGTEPTVSRGKGVKGGQGEARTSA